MSFLTGIPTDTPEVFMEDLHAADQLIHKGIFSPDLEHYFYTISDKEFKQFDVYVIRKLEDSWTAPQKAFFNSEYSEHGMSFSPDSQTIYFSSTRPNKDQSISDTWHIWKSEKINGNWLEPIYVDIPNLREKLVSHPIITNSGTLYFHSSNFDYSDMDIYHSKRINGVFGNAVRTCISTNSKSGRCTPYVAPNEDFIIFASIGNQLDLMISFNDGKGNWTNTRRLSDSINKEGKGNPYITPDKKFLFYTTGNTQDMEWKIKWVDFESELIKSNTHFSYNSQ